MKSKNKITPATFINSRITAAISISLVLFLLGLVVLLSLLANNLSNYIKENMSFDVVLNEDIQETQIKSIQNMLDTAPYTKETRYISKQAGAAQLEKDLGQNPEVLLGFNPLPPIIEVKLNSEYANSDSILLIEKNLRKMDLQITDIQYRKEFIQMVNENMKQIGLIILGLALLLMFVSFVLISNTIRLIIYSKRFLIHTMRLVGATNGFITRPFIRSNILSGITAALIAIALIFWLIYYVSNNIVDLKDIIDLHVLLTVALSVLFFGIVISIVATWMAVNKYLRMRVGDLYYI